MVIGATVPGVIDVVYKLYHTPWIGSVHLDVATAETHTESGEATEHAVEEGSNISDNYRPSPRLISIDATISNTPLKAPLSHPNNVLPVNVEFEWSDPTIKIPGIDYTLPTGGYLGEGFKAVASASGIDKKKGTARGFSPGFDRCADVYAELSRLVQDGEVVSILTAFQPYDNMVIESLSITDVVAERIQNFLNINSIDVSMTLKQIRTVSTRLVAAPEPDPTKEAAKGKKDKGKKATAELNEVEEERASALHQIFNP